MNAARRPLPQRRGAQRGLRLRTLLQVMSLIGVFVLILMASWGYVRIDAGTLFGETSKGERPPPDRSIYRIGSILLVPPGGSRCEERQFDNFTGRIVAESVVNCEERLTEISPEPQTPSGQARMKAVLENFKR